MTSFLVCKCSVSLLQNYSILFTKISWSRDQFWATKPRPRWLETEIGAKEPRPRPRPHKTGLATGLETYNPATSTQKYSDWHNYWDDFLSRMLKGYLHLTFRLLCRSWWSSHQLKMLSWWWGCTLAPIFCLCTPSAHLIFSGFEKTHAWCIVNKSRVKIYQITSNLSYAKNILK